MLYYNWYCQGQHSEKIKQWHSLYGRVIRITPNELHFSDPEAHKTIYTSSTMSKASSYYAFMSEDALVGRLNIHESKRTRKIFAGFFSLSSIRTHSKPEGLLCNKAIALVDSLRSLCSGGCTGRVVNITDRSRCFTYDILHEVVLDPSDRLKMISPEFKPLFVVANSKVSTRLWLAQQFPLLVKIVRELPDFLLSSNLLTLKNEREVCHQKISCGADPNFSFSSVTARLCHGHVLS
jgi:hypothetical protein